MYDKPQYVTYNVSGHDFGNGDRTLKIRPPKGKKVGRVADIHVASLELFNAVSTQARVQVGKAGDLDAFADLPLGTLANGASLSTGDVDDSLGNAFDIDNEGITELTVTLLAPTGGTPAGQGDVAITLAWSA